MLHRGLNQLASWILTSLRSTLSISDMYEENVGMIVNLPSALPLHSPILGLFQHLLLPITDMTISELYTHSV